MHLVVLGKKILLKTAYALIKVFNSIYFFFSYYITEYAVYE